MLHIESKDSVVIEVLYPMGIIHGMLILKRQAKLVKKNIDLLHGRILRSLTGLAFPIMATPLVQAAYNLTGTAWIGTAGSGAVAAVEAATTYTWLSSDMITLARTGGQVKSTHAHSEGDLVKVVQYGKDAL